MKITLTRFATDFTKLAEYFGPDDYEKNLSVFENLTTVRANTTRPFSEFKSEDRNIENKKRVKNGINYFKYIYNYS